LPLGAFVGGLLGGAIGVRATLLVAAVGGALAFVPPLLSPLRTMRELPSYQLAEAVSG
jgi:predicted MFS family arabinose efflux permease